MEWFKNHTDTVFILGGIVGSIVWMNGKFNQIEKDLDVVKIVLIMKDSMPRELAHRGLKYDEKSMEK